MNFFIDVDASRSDFRYNTKYIRVFHEKNGIKPGEEPCIANITAVRVSLNTYGLNELNKKEIIQSVKNYCHDNSESVGVNYDNAHKKLISKDYQEFYNNIYEILSGNRTKNN